MGCLTPVLPVAAQEVDDSRSPGEFKRLGADAVENEPVLDLSLPEPESRPETQEQIAARREQTRQAAIAESLEAARTAMRAGRVDYPREDSAWSHFRKVLDIDPGNVEALNGLAAVQRAMVSRAVS